MAINPKRILMQVAMRTLQLSGSDHAELDASYTLGYVGLDGADVPLSGFVDAVVAVEAGLAELIANDKANPYRSLLYGRSEDLASGELLPTVDENGVKMIGIYSSVKDATSELPLTEGSIQEIRRFRRSSPSRYTTEIYKYKIDGGALHHTRTNAYVEGCVFNRTAALLRMGAESTALSPLPTSFEGLWVAETLRFLVTEGWLIPEAEHYARYAESCVARIKARDTDIPVLPSMDANANAVTN